MRRHVQQQTDPDVNQKQHNQKNMSAQRGKWRETRVQKADQPFQQSGTKQIAILEPAAKNLERLPERGRGGPEEPVQRRRRLIHQAGFQRQGRHSKQNHKYHQENPQYHFDFVITGVKPLQGFQLTLGILLCPVGMRPCTVGMPLHTAAGVLSGG